MCQKVIINRGEKEIESPRQFEQHFGFLPDKEIHYDSIDMDCCLCSCDIDATFKEKRIEYGTCAFGDYYVGELDKCELMYRFFPNGKHVTEISIDDANTENMRGFVPKGKYKGISLEGITAEKIIEISQNARVALDKIGFSGEKAAKMWEGLSGGMDKIHLLMKRSHELSIMSKRKKRRNRHKKKKVEFTFAYKHTSLPPTEEEVIHKAVFKLGSEMLKYE